MGIEPCCIPNLEIMLVDLAKIFQRNHLHYWLDWGALLGIVRGNNLIPHDKDLDIGIFENEISKYNSLKTQIEDKGYNFIPINYDALFSVDDFVPRIFFGSSFPDHCRNLCACDTFVWKEDNGKAHLLNCRRTKIYCNADYYKKLDRIRWKNCRLKIPSNSIKYLEMRYGPTWRIPDPYFYKKYSIPGSE